MSIGNEHETRDDNHIPSSSGKPLRNLRLCIIGAGMGGLACALALAKRGFETIEVYEYASDLGFVGAGIQMAPNMARILDKLGVWDEIEKKSVAIEHVSIREGHNDSELGHQDLRHVRQKYGYPHVVGHRSTLANAIYNGCVRESAAIKFFFNTSVEQITCFGTNTQPSFLARPRNSSELPRTIRADVILAADGVKSVTRVGMLAETGAAAHVQDTGTAAYRIMLTRAQLSSDPDLLALLDANQVTRWVGPRRHIIAYPVSNKEIYNVSTAQPDTHFASAPSASYTTKGSKQAMKDTYSDFCPLVQRMLDLVPEGEVCEWKLRVHSPLPTWVHGCTALLGDAVHPTLPHLNQGAAQAIEDAAVLAVVLAFAADTTPSALHAALKSYEHVRRERAETLVAMAAASGRAMHLAEGRAKEERDRQFRLAREGRGPMPDRWVDPDVQRMIYRHDCVALAEEWMLGSRLRAGL